MFPAFGQGTTAVIFWVTCIAHICQPFFIAQKLIYIVKEYFMKIVQVIFVVLAVLAVILFISATVVKENAKGDLREQCARHPESAACMPF